MNTLIGNLDPVKIQISNSRHKFRRDEQCRSFRYSATFSSAGQEQDGQISLCFFFSVIENV